MTELPSGTVTFLFTDIEGSTGLLKRLGRDQYESALAEHDGILNSVLVDHGGQVVDTQGDSFFVAFRAARDAVAASVAAQLELSKCNWPDEVELRVRMGLHSGEPKASAERYVGIGVHRAARIGSAAHGGQILLSSSTRELVEDDLPDGVFLLELGSYPLKDIERPERLSQVVAPGLKTAFPPLRGTERIADAQRSVFRRRSIVFPSLAGVLAAAVAIPVFALGQGSPHSVARASTLVRLDPASAKPTDGVFVAGRPTAVTTCAASVFVASRDGHVFEIDPSTFTSEAILVGGRPGDISHVGNYAISVSGSPKASLTVIDTGTGTPNAPFALPGAAPAAARVAVLGADVWVANSNVRAVERVSSPYTGTSESIPLPRLRRGPGLAGYAGIAAGEGALWVAGNEANHDLWRVDPATRRVTTIRLPFAPRAVAAGDGGVWVADRADGAVVRVDPRTTRLGRRIAVGRDPSAVTVGAGFVWVANELDGTVSRVDPRTGRVKNTTVGGRPVALAVGLGAVWVVRRTS